jgi:hypothetical protein
MATTVPYNGSPAALGAAGREGVMARVPVRGGAHRGWVAASWVAPLGGANLLFGVVVASSASVTSR